MALDYDIYEILCEISKVNPDLENTINKTTTGVAMMGAPTGLGNTINEATKGATAMGVSTLIGAAVGGLIGGPMGVIIGGAIGFISGTGYADTNTKVFKPLPQVLGEMSREDKAKLVEVAIRIIRRNGINVAQQLIGQYGTQFAKDFLIKVYKEFIRNTVKK